MKELKPGDEFKQPVGSLVSYVDPGWRTQPMNLRQVVACDGDNGTHFIVGGYHDTKRLELWEHSDLLKLKAAVEKALEVTPKPPEPLWRVRNSYIDDKYYVEERSPCTDIWNQRFETGHRFLAEEYVSWKNGQANP